MKNHCRLVTLMISKVTVLGTILLGWVCEHIGGFVTSHMIGEVSLQYLAKGLYRMTMYCYQEQEVLWYLRPGEGESQNKKIVAVTLTKLQGSRSSIPVSSCGCRFLGLGEDSETGWVCSNTLPLS